MAPRVGWHPRLDGIMIWHLEWDGTLDGMASHVGWHHNMAPWVGRHPDEDGTPGGIGPRVGWHIEWYGILGGMAPRVA